MTLFSKNKRFSFESEIKLSLLLLILFLVVLNLGTSILLTQTKIALENEVENSLSSASFAGVKFVQQNLNQEPKNFLSQLYDLSAQLNLSSITILDENNTILFSTRLDFTREGQKKFELNKFLKGKNKKGVNGIYSPVYLGENGEYYQGFLTSFTSSSNQKLKLWVEKDMTLWKGIEKTAKFNSYLKFFGLLILLILLYFLVRTILSPFRKLKKKALDASALLEEKPREKDEVEFVITTFQKTINELKQKEEILKKLLAKSSQESKNLGRFNRYILKSINSGVIILDTTGRVTQFNRFAQEILGLDEKDVLNKNFCEVFSKESDLAKTVELALKENKVFARLEIEFKKNDGENVYLGLNSSLVKNEEEKILGVIILLTDLTQVKKLQDEIVFKDKMAALGEMSAGLAHELRNSMNAISGFGKLLKKSFKEDKNILEIVEAIINESLTMEGMLSKFLNFAKPMELYLSQVNLKEILEELFESNKQGLQEKKVNYSTAFEGASLFIEADALLLKQVFQNLLQNSLDAVFPEGKIEVQIKPQEKSVLVIWKDNGCGIPEEKLSKIFLPFFTTKEKGVGLGLSLVKKIVNLHNGEITVESTKGKGTSFVITLPLQIKKEKIKEFSFSKASL